MNGPAGSPSRRGIWALLVFGCLAGLSTYIVTPLEQPEQVMLASDVYRHAVQSWLAGDGLYGVHPSGRPGYTFLYPPLAVFAFLPHAIVPSAGAAFVLQTVLNVAAAVGTAIVIVRALERRDVRIDRRDQALIAAFMLLSSYSAIQFLNGQVNLWLALAIAVGFEAIDRDRSHAGGTAFALAALLKVFPAALGLWLLRLRATRALGAALATGIGGLLIGAALLGPDLTATYLGDVLLGRFEGATYAAPPTPDDNVDGIHRQLATVWPAGMAYHTPAGLAILAPLLVIALTDVHTQLRRDIAGLATLVATLLFLPLQPLYFPLVAYSVVVLLYTLPSGIERRLFLLGTALTFVHVDQASVDLGLRVLAIPEPVAGGIGDLTAGLFSFVLPPTAGLWILLFTCVLMQLPAVEVDGPRHTTTPA